MPSDILRLVSYGSHVCNWFCCAAIFHVILKPKSFHLNWFFSINWSNPINQQISFIDSINTLQRKCRTKLQILAYAYLYPSFWHGATPEIINNLLYFKHSLRSITFIKIREWNAVDRDIYPHRSTGRRPLERVPSLLSLIVTLYVWRIGRRSD